MHIVSIRGFRRLVDITLAEDLLCCDWSHEFSILSTARPRAIATKKVSAKQSLMKSKARQNFQWHGSGQAIILPLPGTCLGTSS